jgi:hypothetical protein
MGKENAKQNEKEERIATTMASHEHTFRGVVDQLLYADSNRQPLGFRFSGPAVLRQKTAAGSDVDRYSCKALANCTDLADAEWNQKLCTPGLK